MVSCIRHRANQSEDDYFVIAEKGGALTTLQLKSGTVLHAGEVVEFSINDAIENALIVDEGKEHDRLEELLGKQSKALRQKHYATGIGEVDEVTSRMWKQLSGAASMLLRKLAIAAPITIRFHNDIDGACGAYCLSKAISEAVSKMGEEYAPNIHWRMHSGVSYGRIEATSDTLVMNNYECIEKPLLVILDFGTAKESNPGIELVKDRFDIIWLDHHPMVEGFAGRELKHYVNPWLFGGDSNYTAGFLTCALSKTFADVKSAEIENASFIGDYSEYAKPNEASRRLAALLDLLTSDTKLVSGSGSDSLDPALIDGILGDSRRSAGLIAYAENRVMEMLDTAMGSIKEYKGKGANIYVADFESLRGSDETRYPLPGRFSSRLLDRIEELNKVPCILVLHFKSFISIRMSKQLSERIGLLDILGRIKEDHPDDVDSSGGHSNAASVKLKGDLRKSAVIKSLVERLKERAL